MKMNLYCLLAIPKIFNCSLYTLLDMFNAKLRNCYSRQTFWCSLTVEDKKNHEKLRHYFRCITMLYNYLVLNDKL